MKNYNIVLSDETFIEIDNVLSGIICGSQENEDVTDLVNSLMTLVRSDETWGFYYIFIRFLERLVSIRNVTRSTKLLIDTNLFRRHLNVIVSTTNIIKDNNLDFKRVLEELNIVETKSNLEEGKLFQQQTLFSYCLDKFEALQDLQVDIVHATLYLDNVYQSILTDYSVHSVQMGALALHEGVVFDKKEYFKGEGYFELTQTLLAKVEEKKAIWEQLKANIIALDSVESYNKIMSRSKVILRPICTFGIKPFDEYGMLTTADIINVTATEGTGKTTLCCSVAATEIMKGFSTIFICGETQESIIVNMILSKFIFLKTGYEIHWKEIMYIYGQLTNDVLDEGETLDDFKDMPEEYFAIVNDCKYDLYTNPNYGTLFPIQNTSYNNFRKIIKNIIVANPKKKFGHIFVDHTDALEIDNSNSTRYIKDKYSAISILFKDLIYFKVNYGIPGFTTSHTGSEAAKLVAQGKETGTRTGATNSATSKDVDIVLTLEASNELKRQGLLMAVIKKWRSIDDTLFSPCILKKNFTACNFDYYPELQKLLGKQESKLNTSDMGLDNMNAEDLIG